MRKVALVLGVSLVAVAVVVFFNFVWPTVAPMTGRDSGVVFSSDDSQTGRVGNIAARFTPAILRESRTRRDLVVYEQDVETYNTVTSTPANIGLFTKSMMVHSFGTGVYTVDLTQLSEASVSVDEATRTVTVAVPRACLRYITKDLDRTEFESTERGLLAFGELVLTQQQQAALDVEIEQRMRVELASIDAFAQADLAALDAVAAVLEPVVDKVDSSYSVAIVFDDTTENLDLT